MENTTFMMSTTTNHVYQQVCYVERNNETIYYTNQWSSTSVESMSVFKHPAETTSYNRNNTPAEATSYRLGNSSAAKTPAADASNNSNNTEKYSQVTAEKCRAKSTCEEYISRFFAGEDIGVNGLERWLSEENQ